MSAKDNPLSFTDFLWELVEEYINKSKGRASKNILEEKSKKNIIRLKKANYNKHYINIYKYISY